MRYFKNQMNGGFFKVFFALLWAPTWLRIMLLWTLSLFKNLIFSPLWIFYTDFEFFKHHTKIFLILITGILVFEMSWS
jgi:hypothetical protein